MALYFFLYFFVFLRHLDTVFEGLPVKTFQIVQSAHDEILVRVVKVDGYSEKDTAFIKRNILWRHFQETTKVEVEASSRSLWKNLGRDGIS